MNRKIVAAGVTVVLLVVAVYVWPEKQVKEQRKQEQQSPKEMNIRKMAVAGSFYPSSPEGLKKAVTTYIDGAPYLELPHIHGLVCPHAGYIYSGSTAGYSYRQLSDEYDTVILIGPSHYVLFQGASLPEYTHFETPLGLVKVSEKAEELRKNPLFVTVPEAHTQEHCLEVQLPFLQCVLTDFEIIPIVLGTCDPREVASALSPYVDERTLVIASSDLSHYYPYEVARELDEPCIEGVPSLDFEKVQSCKACGLQALVTLMYLAEEKEWQGTLLDYKTSGDTSGDKERVVGYMSAAFYGESYLNEEEQHFLLELARQTLTTYLRDGTYPTVDESQLGERLKEKRACFVTLNERGMLRGCIGTLTAEEELYKSVIQNAVKAAVRDPRFPPVTQEELQTITIEISVLTPPQKIAYQGTEDLITQIQGKGVIISSGLYRATFLPQVWEQLPDPAEFLTHLCAKAGLPQDYWKTGELEVQVYSAQVFGEE